MGVRTLANVSARTPTLMTKDLGGATIGPLKQYNAILFDLGKVLIPFDFSRAFDRMSLRCGLSPDEIRGRLAGAQIFGEFECGAITPAAFAQSVTKELNIEGNFVEFCEIWTSIFLPDPLLPESLIAKLRRNYRTVIVSNTNEIHFDMLRKTYGIIGQFDDYVLSYQIGAMKPNPAFYQAAIASAGCDPERCIFIDDLEENVAGARAAGMDGIRFLDREQLEAELKARNVIL